jgi:membrane-associated phospholipid phosphatase
MDELATGARWLQINSGHDLTFGLAAMPSLHAGASFIFLCYAWRHVRWLGVVYVPVFIWILFEAMASRWHYGVDLVVGVVMAYGCILLAERWMRARETARGETVKPQVSSEKEPVAVAE